MPYFHTDSPAARARVLRWARDYAARPVTVAYARQLLALPVRVQKLVYAVAAEDEPAAAEALAALIP